MTAAPMADISIVKLLCLVGGGLNKSVVPPVISEDFIKCAENVTPMPVVPPENPRRRDGLFVCIERVVFGHPMRGPGKYN